MAEEAPLLAEITDESLGLRSVGHSERYLLRRASRAVLFKNGKIALMNVSRHKYHKLPGGGIEEEETRLRALRREITEETGCSAKILGKIGTVLETRSRFRLGLVQISYCFFASVARTGQASLEQSEIREGFRLEWAELPEALRLLRRDRPTNYEGRFVLARDSAFLRKAAEMLRRSPALAG